MESEDGLSSSSAAAIILIGGRAAGRTAVHRLNTSTLAIEEVATAGEAPVGLTHHTARQVPEGIEVRGGIALLPAEAGPGSGALGRQVSTDVYVLDVATVPAVWRKHNRWD